MNETLQKLFSITAEFGKKTVAETGNIWHELKIGDSDDNTIANNVLNILEKEDGFDREPVGIGTIKFIKNDVSGLYRIDIKTNDYYKTFKDTPHTVDIYVLK